MEMNLEIISHQRHSMSDKQSQFCFKAAGGTIGRSNTNDWIIDDQERLISGHHCAVHFENNQFVILDTSTNGLFVNDDIHPLGDRTHMVSNGDVFTLGEYRLQAILISTQNNTVFSSSSPQYDNAVSYSQNPQPVHSEANRNNQSVPLFPSMVSNEMMSNTLIKELDPLNCIDESPLSGRLSTQDVLKKKDPVNSVLNSLASTHTYFDLPAAIPEDWHSSEQDHEVSLNTPDVGSFEDFQNDFNIKAINRNNQTSEQSQVSNIDEHKKIDINESEQQATESVSNNPELFSNDVESASDDITLSENSNEQADWLTLSKDTLEDKAGLIVLFNTLGINPDDISNEQIPNLLKNIALITKGSMSGLMQTMLSRAHLKNEFRMSMTTIQTQENNPLKFCINYQQLLNYMLVNPMSGYLDADNAIRQSFNELQEHQIGVMAGMKSALMHMLDKISPEKVMDKADRTRSKSLLLGNKKSRYWDAYSDIYNDILDEDDVFNSLFANQFCKAYEHQIDSIRQHKNK